MKKFLPEGMLADSDALPGGNQELIYAMKNARILQGRALMCTRDRDLVVAALGRELTIPRGETAIGADTGDVKDIAVLSRVGKHVSFMITGLDKAPDGSLIPRISRRAAQKAALEHLMTGVTAGDVLPAVVTHLESFGAFVDIGCGITSLVGIENISVARIGHPSARFAPGQRINVLVTGIDTDLDRVHLSHKELLGTWAENAELFRPGDTVAGIVRGVKDYGIFIELTPNLSGLAEWREGLVTGQRVSVYIKSIIPEKRKVKLALIDTLPPESGPAPLRYFISSGHIDSWSY